MQITFKSTRRYWPITNGKSMALPPPVVHLRHMIPSLCLGIEASLKRASGASVRYHAFIGRSCQISSFPCWLQPARFPPVPIFGSSNSMMRKKKSKKQPKGRVVAMLGLRLRAPSLDRSGRDHLLAQVVLVLADRAIPRLDRLVLAHQDLLRNLVQQSVKSPVSLVVVMIDVLLRRLWLERAYLKS